MQIVANNTTCRFSPKLQRKTSLKNTLRCCCKIAKGNFWSTAKLFAVTLKGNVATIGCKIPSASVQKNFTKVCVANLLKQNQRVETAERMPSFCRTTYWLQNQIVCMPYLFQMDVQNHFVLFLYLQDLCFVLQYLSSIRDGQTCCCT